MTKKLSKKEVHLAILTFEPVGTMTAKEVVEQLVKTTGWSFDKLLAEVKWLMDQGYLVGPDGSSNRKF